MNFLDILITSPQYFNKKSMRKRKENLLGVKGLSGEFCISLFSVAFFFRWLHIRCADATVVIAMYSIIKYQEKVVHDYFN